MTSIADDPSLPLDMNGTSNQLSNSSHYDHQNSTSNDLNSLSDFETPGTFPNLTSTGKASPGRTRTLKDQELLLNDFKKENFGLKLRIYHLEEALRKRWGDKDDGWQMNIDLQVQLENLKKELADKDQLLLQAKSAIDSMAKDHEEHIRRMGQSASATQTDDTERLEQLLAEKEEELANALRELEEAQEAQDKAAEPLEELEEVKHQLEDKEQEVDELTTNLKEKDIRMKELEIELLTANQRQLAADGEHAQEMREMAEKLDQCKARLRGVEDDLRDKEAELGEQAKELEGARQQARETEAVVQRLQPMIQERDREIERLTRIAHDKESELSEMRSRMREMEEELSRFREAAHRAKMDNQQQSDDLERLRREHEALKNRLQGQQEELQRDSDATQAAKDAIIDQLRRELRDAQDRLNDAENKLVELTTSKAAEIGVLKGTIDDLNRQLEHLERLLKERNNEVGRLTGEKAALERELDKLRNENEELQNQVDDLQKELNRKAREQDQTERSLAELEKLLGKLQQQQNDASSNTDDLADLEAQMASLERGLHGKEAEIEGLKQALQLKDDTIKKLQAELQRMAAELARAEERARQAELEMSRLKGELAALESQGRIAKLSSDDLQAKLMQAFAENEELAKKLREAEEALRDKREAHDRTKAMCDDLHEQIKLLQRQVSDLRSEQDGPHHVTVTHHETTSSHEGTDGQGATKKGAEGGNSSTTLIFGSMPENLLLTILQRLQELNKEIHDGRAEGSNAASSLSAKLEHLTELQRHLEESLHNTPEHSPQRGETAPAGSTTTSYNTYYFGGEGRDEEDRGPDHTPTRHQQRGRDLSSALQDALTQVDALKAELDEVRKRNRSLQARLNESQKRAEEEVRSKSTRTGEPERYRELEKEVDRLLTELDSEKERSQAEREQQQEEFDSLQNQLHSTEEKLADLQQQLDSALRKDVATSTAASGEMERLQDELDEAQDTIASLRGRLDAEESENERLQSELAELRMAGVKGTPTKKDMSTLATSSMPDLHAHETSVKTMSDSWTSPGQSPHKGERPDMRALKEKHEEVTRLNQELQRKCREQLSKSPSTSRRSSTTTTATTTLQWQAKMREQEQALRSEMMEKENNLRSKLRESEARCITKEEEWRGKEVALRRQLVQLEAQLSEALRNSDNLRSRLAEALAESRDKDEEIRNLGKSLAEAQQKIIALEEQLDQLLKKKNSIILDLEALIHHLERQLQLAIDKVEKMKRTMEAVDHTRESREGDDELEREIAELHESIEALSQQLRSAMEENERLHSRGTNTSGVGGASVGGASRTYRSEYSSTTTSSSFADSKQQTDPSKRSFSKQPQGSPKVRSSHRTTTTTTSFTSPKDSSTPHTFTKHTSTSTPKYTYSPHSTSSQFKDSFHSERVTKKSSHTSKGGEDEERPERSRSDDFLSRQRDAGGNSSFTRTSTTTTTTTRGHDLSGVGRPSPGTWRYSGTHPQQPKGGACAFPSGTSPHRPSSFPLHSLGDFDTLETRLQKALDSPTLLASDRSFLEELLMYLRQQKRQLDESRKLLEHLEQQQENEQTNGGTIPASSHIETALSGTIPSEATPQATPHRQQSGGVGSGAAVDLQGHVGPTRVVAMGTQTGARAGASGSGSRLDLSSLYEQLLQTHSSLIEARSTLNQQRKQ